MIRPVTTSLIALSLFAARTEAQGPKVKEPDFDGRSLSSWIADLKALAPYTRNKAPTRSAAWAPAAKSRSACPDHGAR